MSAIRQLIDAHHHEIDALMRRHRGNLPIDDADLLKAQIQHIATLQALLADQERVMKWHAGQQVEPKQHHGEAVITGKGRA